jgi:hypothetical protein
MAIFVLVDPDIIQEMTEKTPSSGEFRIDIGTVCLATQSVEIEIVGSATGVCFSCLRLNAAMLGHSPLSGVSTFAALHRRWSERQRLARKRNGRLRVINGDKETFIEIADPVFQPARDSVSR